MSTPPGLDKFPIPGVRPPSGDAAPSSLLGQLRQTAAAKREAETLTLGLPGRWEGKLRVTYGTVSLDELERLAETAGAAALAESGFDGSLEIMSRAVKSIEAYDPDEDKWHVIEDDFGPVGFEDRLARILNFERPPGEDFTFTPRMVYDVMFDRNGFALSRHCGRVAEWMGVTEESIASLGESSTPARPRS